MLSKRLELGVPNSSLTKSNMLGQELLISLKRNCSEEFTWNPRVVTNIKIFPTDETFTQWTRTVTKVVWSQTRDVDRRTQELKTLGVIEKHHVGSKKRSDTKRSNKDGTELFAGETQIDILC